MPFHMIRQDITKMDVDAIVNAANPALQMGGGVCGAIFKAAGESELQAACQKLAPIQTGEAAITPGFALQARYIIHAVGPVYHPQNAKENAVQLRSAYLSALRLAADHGCERIAFPLISSGLFGYPKDKALTVATAAIRDFLANHEMDVTLAVFDSSAFIVSQTLMGAVESYLDAHYVAAQPAVRRPLLDVEKAMLDAPMSRQVRASAPLADMSVTGKGIDALIGCLDEPFSSTLLRLIDAKGKTDAEVYKRANIDRKLFSKIRTGKGYMPGKRTILALALALELPLAETDDLLERAGYALSHSQQFDVIVEYFIVNGRFDLFEINEVLFQYDQPLLGS